jgi:thioredoxin-like negative regulator of GroEL
MNERLITEEDYREALRRFIEIMENECEAIDEEELLRLMELMETYEYENC